MPTATPTGVPTPTPIPLPTVSGISPDSASTDEGSVTVTIVGENFRDIPEVFLISDMHGDIAATDVSVTAGSRIRCSFNIADAEPGVWGVLVSNPDDTWGELDEVFTITAPQPQPLQPSPAQPLQPPPTPAPVYRKPEITGFSPENVQSDIPVEVTIMGENLGQVTSVSLIGPGRSESCTIQPISDSQIRCSFRGIGVPYTQEWRLHIEGPGGSDDADKGFYVIKEKEKPKKEEGGK